MLGVFWNPQDLLLLMGTEIFKIDASWAEKLKKTRVSKIPSPTVISLCSFADKNSSECCMLYSVALLGCCGMCRDNSGWFATLNFGGQVLLHESW